MKTIGAGEENFSFTPALLRGVVALALGLETVYAVSCLLSGVWNRLKPR